MLAEQKVVGSNPVGHTKTEEDRKKVVNIANDWKEKATDMFMFARYAKEDFDSDDWERKRAVIKRLGADLKLSARTIQFTPVKYLIPIAEKYSGLRQKNKSTRTDSQQIKNSPLEADFSVWYARQDLNLRPFAPQANALSS